ncbi:MAG: transposase family protein [Bacteroidales bacterium]|nr:transposase family protein [Bacteroidales bacterium]
MTDRKSHLEHFSEVENPRVQGRVLHTSVNIIYITITAALCGVSGWEEIDDFAESRRTGFLPSRNFLTCLMSRVR